MAIRKYAPTPRTRARVVSDSVKSTERKPDRILLGVAKHRSKGRTQPRRDHLPHPWRAP